VLKPIEKVINLGMTDNIPELEKVVRCVSCFAVSHMRGTQVLGSLGLSLTTADKEKSGKKLMKCVMQKWLPAHEGA
jgi:hypothetical protein